MIKIINFTPHVIVILKKEYSVANGKRIPEWVPGVSFPPSGNIVTCIGNTETEAFVETGDSFRVPLTYTDYAPPTTLPPIEPNTIYIVSELVARLCPHRQDFRIVNGVIRDDNGRVIGCRSLGRIKHPLDLALIRSMEEDVCNVEGLLESYGALGDDEDNLRHTTNLYNKLNSLMQLVDTKG